MTSSHPVKLAHAHIPVLSWIKRLFAARAGQPSSRLNLPTNSCRLSTPSQKWMSRIGTQRRSRWVLSPASIISKQDPPFLTMPSLIGVDADVWTGPLESNDSAEALRSATTVSSSNHGPGSKR